MARMQVRAVLCDLDGTLADSGDGVLQAWTIFAERHGLDPAPFLQRCHGVRTNELVTQLAPQLDIGDAVVEVEKILADIGAPPTAGARELTAFLPDGAWAIVTSSTLALAESRFVSPTSLRRPPVLITAEDVTKGKPDPQGYELAAERLNVPPESCLVLEDAPAGVAAGKAAGMLVAGVLTTHKPNQLRSADFLIRDPAQIRVLGALARTGGGWDVALNIDQVPG